MKQSAGLVTFVLLAALCLAPCASGQEQEEVLINADIIALTEAGVPAEAIVIKIESTRSDFDTTVEQLIALSGAGVDASVVSAMTRKDTIETPEAETELESPQPGLEPAAPVRAGPVPQPTAPAQPQEEPQPARPPEPAVTEIVAEEAAPSDAPAALPVSAPTQTSVLPSAPVAPFQSGSAFADALASGGSGPEMVVIPAGRFRMGCVTRSGCFRDERPVHRVFFAEPIAISRYAVTFEDFDRFAGSNRPADDGWGRGRRPVINVSWDQAVRYSEWLSRETGESYRLLSEAEWEYAARAGSNKKYHFGNDSAELCRYANHADAGTDYEWRNTACSDGVGKQTAIVGSYEPNAFGLYDMHGNVWEWVQDCWNSDYAGAPGDGQAWEVGDCSQRVARGGSWYYAPDILRSASREHYSTDFRNDKGGFRVARIMTPSPEPQQIPPQPFTVVTEPSGARVRIMNIEEPYRAGMALGPGQYEVEVSAAGYTSVRETIRHAREATERRVVLAAIPPQPSPLPQESTRRDVTPVETAPLVQVPPRYPRRAARLQIEGFVRLEFTITRDGNVVEPVVVESRPPNVFDEAALQAIIQWKFEPRVENGRVVESRAQQRIEFGF